MAYKSAALVSEHDNVYTKLVAMRQICRQLGIENTGTRYVINRQKMIELVLPENLLVTMGLTKSQSLSAEITMESKVKTLKRVFKAFSGASLDTLTRKITLNNSPTTANDFVSVPLVQELWNVLRM